MSLKKNLISTFLVKLSRVMVKVGCMILGAVSTFASDSRVKKSYTKTKKPPRNVC